MKILRTYDEVCAECGYVPKETYEALKRYIEDGMQPGGFLQAALENDFTGAVARADTWNSKCLKEINWMLSSAIPHVSYGSPERVRAWLASGFRE